MPKNIPKIMELKTDSYKQFHKDQYPPNTTKVYSYFESRGCSLNLPFTKTVIFGLQYIIQKHLEGVVVTKESIDRAERIVNAHFGRQAFNREGWEYILKKHGGKLPIVIKAVPEGTLIDLHNVLVTVENTDPKCWWLTNFVETLLVQLWYPMTVATYSYYVKQLILEYLEKTGDPSLIDFKFHDFGFRGDSSEESAAIGGAAHLTQFKGTDTLVALLMLEEFYGPIKDDVAGYSIPASEHSTMTSWGRENEIEAMANMLALYPTGLFACVSDQYNIFNAVENIWGGVLKANVMKRNGTLIIRPDSGDPASVIIQLLRIMWSKFGGEINEKGYKVLDSHVRLIQGDGVEYNSIKKILEVMKQSGFSADNITFGCGGKLLQDHTRDDFKFAFKCSFAKIDGKEIDVWKNPITDSGKTSKRGVQKLVWDESSSINHFETVNVGTCWALNLPDELVEVFRDGDMVKTYTLDEIRERVK